MALFQSGSTTKTFTATVAMQLVDDGKLDLDRPIQEYLPGFELCYPDVTAKVTLRHVFTHTGGWATTLSIPGTARMHSLAM